METSPFKIFATKKFRNKVFLRDLPENEIEKLAEEYAIEFHSSKQKEKVKLSDEKIKEILLVGCKLEAFVIEEKEAIKRVRDLFPHLTKESEPESKKCVCICKTVQQAENCVRNCETNWSELV